ncbi:MAG: hypothetical protein AB8U99_03435 [Candidatus Midichloria sp.]
MTVLISVSVLKISSFTFDKGVHKDEVDVVVVTVVVVGVVVVLALGINFSTQSPAYTIHLSSIGSATWISHPSHLR